MNMALKLSIQFYGTKCTFADGLIHTPKEISLDAIAGLDAHRIIEDN